MIKKIIILSSVLVTAPSVVYGAEDIKNLRDLVNVLIGFINSLVPLFLGVAFLAFIWGVIVYLWSANPQKLKEARGYLVFGIISFTVMLSVWGLALMLKGLFFPNANTPLGPTQFEGVDWNPTPGPEGSPIDVPNNPYDNSDVT